MSRFKNTFFLFFIASLSFAHHTSLYRRELPPSATAFSSQQGQQNLSEAISAGYAQPFFKLIEQYSTQADPYFCALTSIVMVLNALQIDPGHNWKGIWRWYDEHQLELHTPMETIKKEGVNFADFITICEKNHLDVQSFYAENTTENEFRTQLLSVMSTTHLYMIVSYGRKTLQQTGTGHFSPIAAYNPKQDQVLILDVARFKYPAHWVPVKLLWTAMQDHDSTTERSRGFALLSHKKQVQT